MKAQLKQIFDAAADEVEALSRKRVELLSKGEDIPSQSASQEQRRVITQISMEQARQLLSGISDTDLINFAALCFAEYHHAEKESRIYRGNFIALGREGMSRLRIIKERDKLFENRLKKARSKGATARHAETRAIKADVFAWLNSLTSEFKSIEAAARAITKQQPITQGTARKYFKEWKNLRSASTP